MDKKVAVYICSGCTIGEKLDLQSLSKLVTGELKIPLCHTHEFLCSEQGINEIKNALEKEKVNALCLAACSARTNWDVFSFGSEILVERVDLREQVAWTHTPEDDEQKEQLQEMAEDYIRMGLAKLKKCELPEPHIEPDFSKSILVVGGGITGMHAALEAADTGYEVHLVEKANQLGGKRLQQWKTFSPNPPFVNLEPADPSPTIQKVMENELITVHLGAHPKSISGAPGKFEVVIQNSAGEESFKAGAIIMATGWKPYDASKLGHLGYGTHPNVITSQEFEKMALGHKIYRPSDNQPAKKVLFIQCAGSRDPDHLPYCSYSCCANSLKQARYCREIDEDSEAYIIYKDMRTPGHFEDFYKAAQDDPGIFLTKGEIQSVQGMDDNHIAVQVGETLLGEDITVQADLVVLATGMVPVASDGEAYRQAIDAFHAAQEQGKEEEANAAKVKLESLHEPILNLTYRQGPDLPQLAYDFPDSHFICFPYESRRTGIYPCGPVRKPMMEPECFNDASGAALKAIQCIEMLHRGEAVHPRAGDMTFPELFLQRCTQCKRCTEECPFGMYDEDEKGTPLPNITRCRRCGICMGSCPERIISFKNYSVDIIGSMVKAIEVPEEDEERPRILVFICENDALPVMDLVGRHRLEISPFVRFIPLRCLGSFNIVWIADALSRGIDGILLMGCKHGDDYQCHFIKGSELAGYRMEKVSETLQRLVLESERIRVHEISIDEYQQVPQLLADFEEKLDELGPNPYKDL